MAIVKLHDTIMELFLTYFRIFLIKTKLELGELMSQDLRLPTSLKMIETVSNLQDLSIQIRSSQKGHTKW